MPGLVVVDPSLSEIEVGLDDSGELSCWRNFPSFGSFLMERNEAALVRKFGLESLDEADSVRASTAVAELFEDGDKELPLEVGISGTGTGFLSSNDLSDGALKIRSDESDSSPTLAVLDGNDFAEPVPKDGKTNLRLLVVTTSTLDLESPREYLYRWNIPANTSINIPIKKSE